jgi:uncharacterized membrane protein HdeD (DUF308 family)
MSRANQKESDLAWKGGLCAAIGLIILLSPQFMGASPLRDMVAQSAVVGWFALVLGLAFLGQFFWRRRASGSASR